ncbi:MAG: hypothetical protein Q4A53_03455 [Porphyromonas sp.]|nr:hypothetical protein [Porphyromonas sp.]
MSAVTPASLPLFLQKFSAYHFRVRFEARQAFTFSGKWYFLPRYALGNALKNSSRFSHLYGELFKPHETEDGTNSSSRLIIRADKPSRRGFSRGEALDIYITIISQDPQLVEDFLTFLPSGRRTTSLTITASSTVLTNSSAPKPLSTATDRLSIKHAL